VIISAAASTPAAFLLPLSDSGKLNILQFLVPVIGGAIGALYLAIGCRDWLWTPEKKANVRRQITNEFLDMIPDDLDITASERGRLANAELGKELTGVFWEAIDGDPQLRECKQFFYKNGAFYTSVIDAALLLPAFALIYCIFWLTGLGRANIFIAVICLALTLVALLVAIPRCRSKHMLLSQEQLEEIRGSRLGFVQSRFRELIAEWRQR
jgi:hypothetical protein